MYTSSYKSCTNNCFTHIYKLAMSNTKIKKMSIYKSVFFKLHTVQIVQRNKYTMDIIHGQYACVEYVHAR